MDSAGKLLYRAASHLLEFLERVKVVEVSIKLAGHGGRGKCVVREHGGKGVIIFKLPEEGTSVEDLAISCIHYLGDPWRTYLPASSFAFFLLAAAASFIRSSGTGIIVMLLASAGAVLLVISALYIYREENRLRKVNEELFKLSEGDTRVRELYSFFTNFISYLLSQCRGGHKAVIDGGRLLKDFMKAHRKTFKIIKAQR
jgi:hypothetical protein